jgi:hypothetical protein
MSERVEAAEVLQFLGRCIAPAPDVLRPSGRGREALEETIRNLEAVRELAPPGDPCRELTEAMIEGALHRMDTGCFCKFAEANQLQSALQRGGLVPRATTAKQRSNA